MSVSTENTVHFYQYLSMTANINRILGLTSLTHISH
jgi:hypothetical protein